MGRVLPWGAGLEGGARRACHRGWIPRGQRYPAGTVSRLDQRSSLDTLTKARLLELAAKFELDVAASHPKAELIDTLAASKRASFEQILLVLSRDELKEICRSHGGDDKGREKQVIIDRILGREATSKGKRVYDVAKEKAGSDAAGPPSKRGRGNKSAASDERQGTLVAGKYRAPNDQGETASEVVLEYEALLRQPPAADASDKPRRRGRGRRAAGEGPDATVRVAAEEDAVWAASTKMRLRRFSVEAAGGYRGREGDVQFAQDLIRCFGWGPDEALPAEIPAIVDVVERGQRTDRRLCARLRERRAVVEIVDRDRSTSDAWTDLLPIILQLEPVPQYVVLSNQRDVVLYDLARSRTEHRLTIPLDQLSKYSEAFPFLARDWSPGATPQIINVERVSTDVADLVAKVYRSFAAQHPDRLDEVIRFTLQCIIAMFAEDIAYSGASGQPDRRTWAGVPKHLGNGSEATSVSGWVDMVRCWC
jgi:hypothetical protein